MTTFQVGDEVDVDVPTIVDHVYLDGVVRVKADLSPHGDIYFNTSPEMLTLRKRAVPAKPFPGTLIEATDGYGYAHRFIVTNTDTLVRVYNDGWTGESSWDWPSLNRANDRTVGIVG